MSQRASTATAFHRLIIDYKGNARKRDLEWSLSETQVQTLVFANCHYCGQSPSRLQRRAANKDRQPGPAILVNGIDRLNPELGYTTENCVSCCFPCNSAKSKLSEEDFLALVARIYKHSINGGTG